MYYDYIVRVVHTRALMATNAHAHSKCGYNLFLIGYMSAIGRPFLFRSTKIEHSIHTIEICFSMYFSIKIAAAAAPATKTTTTMAAVK